MFTIYELVDPRDDSVRYVGITNDVYARMRQHSRGERNNPAKNAWLRELQELQLMFIMRSVGQVETFEEARVQEDRLIWNYRISSVRLLNVVGPRFKHRGLGIGLPEKEKDSSPQTKPSRTPVGRGRTFADVIDMLIGVRETGKWPDTLTTQMQRHYRREYPEFFKNSKRAAKAREEQVQKAARIRADNRPSRSRQNPLTNQ